MLKFSRWAMQTRNEQFWTWAETKLREEGLNWSLVEQRAGLSNAAVSKRAKDQKAPTKTTLDAISKVLRIPPERVFRKAGWLPPRIIGQRYYEQKDKLLDYFDALSSVQRDAILGLAETLYLQKEGNRERD